MRNAKNKCVRKIPQISRSTSWTRQNCTTRIMHLTLSYGGSQDVLGVFWITKEISLPTVRFHVPERCHSQGADNQNLRWLVSLNQRLRWATFRRVWSWVIGVQRICWYWKLFVKHMLIYQYVVFILYSIYYTISSACVIILYGWWSRWPSCRFGMAVYQGAFWECCWQGATNFHEEFFLEFRLSKNCFKTDLALDFCGTRARELFVSHEKTSTCLVVAVLYGTRRTNWSTSDLRSHSLLSSWITQSSQSTNLLNACCPVIIGCVCWIQFK